MSVTRYNFDGIPDPCAVIGIPRTDGEYIKYVHYAALLARVARLEEALPDPDKLEILARWFDMQYPADTNPEVQTDLREWAKKIRNVLEGK